jgi:hypothetical protein
MDDIFYLYFCATPTPPPNLLEKKLLEPGVDKPCFARFKCSRCHHVWGSVWAWKKYGQQCSTCIIALQKLVKDRQRTKREVEKEIKKAAQRTWLRLFRDPLLLLRPMRELLGLGEESGGDEVQSENR